MAKQSVSFMERHLEKIVVGVAGLITLTMAAMYVVRSPNSVDAGGTTLGPGDIGSRLKEETKRVYQSILGSKPKPTQVPDYVAEVERWRPTQIDRSLMPRLAVAMTPLNPQPPAVSRIDVTGRSKLAKILPPGKPVVFQGRNRSSLVAPTMLTGLTPEGGAAGAEAAVPAAPDATNVKDITWLTVAAPVFRSKQLGEYNSAGYVPGRTAILVTRVRLERQRLLGNGTWSEPPEEVETYTKYSRFAVPEVKVAEGDAGWDLDADSMKRLTTLLDAVKPPDVQAGLWRPPLAPYIDARDWPPAHAPQIDGVDWQDWQDREAPGVQFKGGALASASPSESSARDRAAKAERTVKRPTRPPTGSEAESAAKAAAAAAAKTRTPAQPKKAPESADARARLKEAEKAFKEGNIASANELLNMVLREGTRLPSDLATKADDLKAKIEDQQKAALEAAAKREKERSDREKGQLEVDVEPVWAHDLTAQPGCTYRYRLQIDVFNQYSNYPRDLAEPRDAEKVILASDWSEWSDPVVVRPDTYLFFVQANPTKGVGGTATVDLYKWSAGEWKRVEKKEFEVGQQIVCDDRKAGHIDTRMTVVDIDSKAARAIRSKARKDGSFDIEPNKDGVQVLLLADADGRVSERNSLDDKNSPDLAELKKEMEKEKESQPREAPRERQPRPPVGAPPRPIGGSRGSGA